MSGRRFTDKPELDPSAVRGLSTTHPAMLENRSLFPSTVIEVTKSKPDRLLVSGANNRKLGATVEKGKFKGYALYGLSLEERATCPKDCSVRAACYGNGMQMARRHRIGDADVFFDRLGFEIAELLDQHEGLLIRLHILGDFPSVEYVAFWADALNEYPKLAIYGYTHRRSKAWGGDEIGEAIQSLKDQFPDRFRVRWSSAVPRDDGAVVIDSVPETPRVSEGIVCPAQREATACCASCALCWEGAKNESIVFLKHGPKSAEVAAQATRKQLSVSGDVRKIAAIQIPKSVKPADVSSALPEMKLVSPNDLFVEQKYQRDLTGKSLKLIQKIVAGWDWTKFKPPVVAQTSSGYFVVDGQHTAMAAASHPSITRIPVFVVDADAIEQRAEAFVSHNRDRLTMTPAQVFYGECAAGDADANNILKAVIRGGGEIPKYRPVEGFKATQITAIGEVRNIYKVHGAETLTRIVKVATLSGITPIAKTVLRALLMIFTEENSFFAETAKLPDEKIAAAISSLAKGDFEGVCREFAVDSEQSRFRAAAVLIAAGCDEESEAA